MESLRIVPGYCCLNKIGRAAASHTESSDEPSLPAQADPRLHSPMRTAILMAAIVACGCNSSILGRKPAPVRQAFVPRELELVDDLARPSGMYPLRLDGVGLVVGLDGTGSDPPPSAERSQLLAEMSKHRVAEPSRVLASKDTALVLVRGVIPPGAQVGDTFDLEITVPLKSETRSLRGGWLMLTPLREYAVLNKRLTAGHILASGQGHIVIDALTEDSGDPTLLTQGRILGGGRVGKTRPLGLTVRDEHTSVKTSAMVGDAINRRFHVYDRGIKGGVANPRRDDFIDLLVHPRYHQNVLRYIRVTQNIVVREKDRSTAERIERLRSQLVRPSTAAIAALQLEAIGDDAIPVLKAALQSSNEEVRFYAAESLGYLNEPAAANILAEIARDEPAFRWRALTAMGAMDKPEAQEELFELLDGNSVETRYGAFRELRRSLPNDPMIAGERLNDAFYLHRVRSMGDPVVHVAREERPEIVLFGPDDIQLITPFVLFAGPRIVVKGESPDKVHVNILSVEDDQEVFPTTTRLHDIIRTIAKANGSYPDVVQALREAQKTGVLPTRLAFSAIPALGRTYQRIDSTLDDDTGPLDDTAVNPPITELTGSP